MVPSAVFHRHSSCAAGSQGHVLDDICQLHASQLTAEVLHDLVGHEPERQDNSLKALSRQQTQEYLQKRALPDWSHRLGKAWDDLRHARSKSAGQHNGFHQAWIPKIASSTREHRMCPRIRWPSWILGVSLEGTSMIWSHESFIGPPRLPVNPTQVNPRLFASSSARRILGDLPEVERAMKTSPCLPSACS